MERLGLCGLDMGGEWTEAMRSKLNLDRILLSLLRGDVFTVYNEMGDGWLWVKSLRTKESGIIFSALVEDMTKNADPNEGKGKLFDVDWRDR